MASTLSSKIQRSTIVLSSTVVRTPARSTASPAAALHRAISAPTRGLATSPQNRTLRSRLAPPCSLRTKSIPNTKSPRQVQTRWNSDEASPIKLREWGFEEINAALPTSTPSPTHKPVILIDVREPAELKGTGVIPSAVCIPLASQGDALYLTPDEFETRFGFPKPDPAESEGEPAQMVFYCKAGVRAKAAAQMAVQAGYDPANVGVYMGSWLDWERHGGKVEKWEGDDF
ncbi:hypothetical protein E8E15_006004 [Penicillium rubens]|uniref:Pc16g08340 protein n=2 Tax=Penicillium chrysogenum species complex TaxID=254878 RepID=B6H834_PENRW|nr:uncharacterized protein N7525_010906 [Penicillium rubens]KZN93901.1 Thiosulfate sulfurtransferase [Penicillium chrysogenum]CAP93504.1 Pc16g08340 [Penicillium rubens Wisconsin 54-1255]KAF3028423.1 hypothetical protein E8E15_006004 [Penicillium rubens]KAJ5036573.1 Thiosulfate sulfurtransferase rdl2, mitochondrial [Penicillium rubens]KAJ5821622.1 hypothetical protein N7525_010906 [Penicillium rubens]